MANDTGKEWLNNLGSSVSAAVAEFAANPFAQIGVIIFCAAWWLIDLPTDILTAGLSILAITLTQMVLNRQADRELDAHRRDVAMHAKLDDLVIALRGAHNELAGIEELEEEDIQQLKADLHEAIDKAGNPGLDADERADAKASLDEVLDQRKGANGARR